ncbi:hypothetical protein BKA62DRAFT_673771 [Auriculariales sp. MPI-PUGE-AT-0066]|nr:hypothetical protein BKA62DRAFT_673771 [Auriculariales sp. MPI-PUGE-AT-0066]
MGALQSKLKERKRRRKEAKARKNSANADGITGPGAQAEDDTPAVTSRDAPPTTVWTSATKTPARTSITSSPAPASVGMGGPSVSPVSPIMNGASSIPLPYHPTSSKSPAAAPLSYDELRKQIRAKSSASPTQSYRPTSSLTSPGRFRTSNIPDDGGAERQRAAILGMFQQLGQDVAVPMHIGSDALPKPKLSPEERRRREWEEKQREKEKEKERKEEEYIVYY